MANLLKCGNNICLTQQLELGLVPSTPLLCRLIPVWSLPAIPPKFTDRGMKNLPSPLGNGVGLSEGSSICWESPSFGLSRGMGVLVPAQKRKRHNTFCSSLNLGTLNSRDPPLHHWGLVSEAESLQIWFRSDPEVSLFPILVTIFLSQLGRRCWGWNPRFCGYETTVLHPGSTDNYLFMLRQDLAKLLMLALNLLSYPDSSFTHHPPAPASRVVYTARPNLVTV